jgi:hypothetical protein
VWIVVETTRVRFPSCVFIRVLVQEQRDRVRGVLIMKKNVQCLLLTTWERPF